MFPPDSPRVIYAHNPLDTVIAQLKFSPILKIDAEIPAAFQESISEWFPIMDDNPQGMPFLHQEGIPEALQLSAGVQQMSHYRFSSEDDFTKVDLTRNSLSVTTKKYEKWDTFSGILREVHSSFTAVYNPKKYMRIGLRYFNVINKLRIGMKDKPWRELINHALIGAFADENAEMYIGLHEHATGFSFNESGIKIRLISKLVNHIEDNVPCFLLDIDSFIDHAEVLDNAINRFDSLNTLSSSMIRWCFQKELHDALEPKGDDLT